MKTKSKYHVDGVEPCKSEDATLLNVLKMIKNDVVKFCKTKFNKKHK